MPSERSDVEEYWVVRTAVRDGIWDVIGTILAVLVAGFLLFVGLGLVSQGLLSPNGLAGLATAAFGAVLVLGAAVMVMREFSIYPFD